MDAEKISTLRLLKEGMGKSVQVLEAQESGASHEVRAFIENCAESSVIPVLFLLTSLAFLEAIPDTESGQDFSEVDGWTPADFLSHLRFEDQELKLSLGLIRGRAVNTSVALSYMGELTLSTSGRGQPARRWLSFVQGRTHLQEVQV